MNTRPTHTVNISTNTIINAITADRSHARETLVSRYTDLPVPNYSLPMAWSCAISASNTLVDAVPRYSSADHGTIFKSLLAVLNTVQSTAKAPFSTPHFDAALSLDESIQTCLEGEYGQQSMLNLAVSLQEGYWRFLYNTEKDSFRLSLAPSQRRSALTLLDHKVEFEAYPPDVRDILSDASPRTDLVSLTFAIGTREVSFLQNAVPDAWKRLTDQIGFGVGDAGVFMAFVHELMATGQSWFRVEDLLEAFSDFSQKHERVGMGEDRLRRLVAFFAASPDQLEEWGIAVPLVRFGDWMAYWPFVHHVLPPSLTLLCLLMRKHPEAWNNTVGSELAKVANSIRDNLGEPSRLLFATRRVRAEVGDIDLAIYDPGTRVLLLCEIKTVFDRFRTNYQLSNFTGQRVNFSKAKVQLKKASDAISSGRWTLSDIFGCKTDSQPPKKILPLVLTWYDQYNPWLAIDGEHPASCNFRVFQHMFHQSEGDLVLMHEAIEQLSRIYCVAALRPWQIPVGDDALTVKREVQTDVLPSSDALGRMPLSKLVRCEIELLLKLPEDWKCQLKEHGENPDDYHFYRFDEP